MTGEKRQHLRLPVATRVFLELLSPNMDSTESGMISMCTTLNVSRGGLQVGLEKEVSVGAILQIGVQLPEADEPLYLAGEVEWCRANESADKGWHAGFKLMNANQSDIDSWVSLLTEMDSDQ